MSDGGEFHAIGCGTAEIGPYFVTYFRDVKLIDHSDGRTTHFAAGAYRAERGEQAIIVPWRARAGEPLTEDEIDRAWQEVRG